MSHYLMHLKHLALAALLMAAPTARGQLTMALTGDSTAQGFSSYGGEVDGYLFRTAPGANLTVGWLGYYDKDGDGLANEHLVRIWKASGAWPVVASATIPAGTADPLVGSFRGHDITPVTLEPNTEYVIAAPCFGDPMREGNNLAGWGLNGISNLAGRYNDPPKDGWAVMINANFGYTQKLTVTLNTPAADQAYPSGTSITATATVGEPGAFADTVSFHTTPISPPGAPVVKVSTDTSSPFTAELGVLPAGTYEIHAKVINDDVPPATATSAIHTFTVAPAIPTTTTLATSGSPSTYGQCTLTATVAPIPTGGTVQFFDGGSPFGSPVAVDTGTGMAQLNANKLGAGTRELTADFSGYGVHSASTTASALTQVVDKAQLTVTALNALRAPNTADPDPFPYQITGYKNGETLASSGVSGTPALTTSATLASPVGDYPITCSLGSLEASNYSFTLVNGTLTIADVANTFSLNFYAYPGPYTEEDKATVRVAPGVPAGMSGWFTSGWANFQVPWGGGLQPSLTLSSNKGATATFTFKDCRNGWAYQSTPRTTLLTDGNGCMMDGHVNSTLDGESNKFEMELTDIPFAVYDVIFYLGANEAQYGDGTGKIVFNGGAERDFTVKPGAFDGTFTEMVDATTPGNYIVFKGVTGSSFTTQTWGTGANGFNHVGPFGFQIREATPAGFSGWQSKNGATGQTLAQDHDNDGVANGIEYFIGGSAGDTTGFTPLPAVTANSVTWTHAADYQGVYGVDFVVETSATLTGAWAVEDADPPTVGAKVTFPTPTTVKYTFPMPLGPAKFVRLRVTGP